MGESQRIEQIFENLVELLTAKELQKMTQIILAKCSKLMSEESNREKMEQLQGSSRGSEFPKESKKGDYTTQSHQSCSS